MVMKIAAITGTNGKSSTIHYARQLLERRGKDVWTITNTGILEPGGNQYQMFWCRERGSIRKLIKDLSPGRNSFVLIEAYSISLMAGEWFGTIVDLAAFTSFGRDHLDVHSSMDTYFEAKFLLFQNSLKPKGTMVIHQSIPNISRFSELSKQKEIEMILYDNEISNHSLHPGILCENLNCALHISRTLSGIEYAYFKPGDIYPLPGRMEEVKNSLDINIYIDYAHNPNGLGFTLGQLKKVCKGKIITVLGCGGDRDPGKRLMMGKVANQFSDKVIVTDDNPRTENPWLIRKAIIEGCPNAYEIASRREAIKTALLIAQKNDTILVAGMGPDAWSTGIGEESQTDRAVINGLIKNT
jgi:UDP-N-acetylmuramoyl-L-alanyl-D-glutamate--2,6-diaminopimelate ligase